MKKYVNIYKFIIVILIVIITVGCLSYNYGISPVSKDSLEVEITIDTDTTYLSLANQLKEKDLIRSVSFYKAYIKIFRPENLQAGKYTLNKNMGVKGIIELLEKGTNYNPDSISITFKEGINMRDIAQTISLNTNNTIDDVYNLLKDEKYLDSLINKYWFITDEIKDKNIYYSLEGYLFPDTYEYENKDVTVEDIFSKMLDKMESVLNKYKTAIKNSSYSVHEILTMASIVELEAANSNDRNGVAGVFYNRLEDMWSLGSDVTTYYAAKLDLNERDLFQSEIDDINAYNTRPQAMAGKLPIGPICIPSEISIEATLNPSVHEYYFFVADKDKKTYFTATYTEHNNIIQQLKSDGKWFQY